MIIEGGILQANYKMIRSCIETSRDQDHLDTCRKMIQDRIEIWGAEDLHNDLLNRIQVKEVELIASRYQEVE
jgi:hypothetical protein